VIQKYLFKKIKELELPVDVDPHIIKDKIIELSGKKTK